MKGFFKLDKNLFVAKDRVESILVEKREFKTQKMYGLRLFFKEEIQIGNGYVTTKYRTKLQKSVKECFEYLQGGENEQKNI